MTDEEMERFLADFESYLVMASNTRSRWRRSLWWFTLWRRRIGRWIAGVDPIEREDR